MKRLLKGILILFFLGSFLMGCGEEETAPEPVEESQLYGEDFRVTITSKQKWYKSEDFKKNAKFTLELEYIGEEPEVTIYHADPLAFIGIDTQEGKCVFDCIWETIQRESILKQGETYQIELDAEELGAILKDLEKSGGAVFNNGVLDEHYEGKVFKNGSLIKGKYQAVAYIWFHTNENVGEGEEYQIKLPLPFEIR